MRIASNARWSCGLADTALPHSQRPSTKMNRKFVLVTSHVTLLAVALLAVVAGASQDQTASNDVVQRPFSCPNDCQCKKPQTVDCRGIGIDNITGLLSQQAGVVKLDLSHNAITHVGGRAFTHMTLLDDLNLSGNNLSVIDEEAFHHPRIKTLSLQNTHITRVPPSMFSHLPSLQILRLDLNEISQLEPLALAKLTSLRHLRLDVNRFDAIPSAALSYLTQLQILNLSFNKLKRIRPAAFSNLTALTVLELDYNSIEAIDDGAFDGLISLKILELRHNRVKELPSQLKPMLYLTELHLNNNNITHIKGGILQQVPRLVNLNLRGNPLVNVDWDAFAFLPRLQKLILSEVKQLRQFPSLNGSVSLELIRIDRADIRSIPSHLCHFTPRLRSLDVKSNAIEAMPDLSNCRNLRLLDMSHNRIGVLEGGHFQQLIHLHDLLLSHNFIRHIPHNAFAGLHKLKTIDLSHNSIESLHQDCFLPLGDVQDVNFGHNMFPSFPSEGLENALHIKVHNNPNLREFPGPISFPRVKSLALSYAYHCCPFQDPRYRHTDIVDDNSLMDSIIFPSDEHDIDLNAWAQGETIWVDSNPLWANISQQWADMAVAATNNDNLTDMEIESLLNSAPNVGNVGSTILLTGQGMHRNKATNPVVCIPEPSPFMPCEDLFDWWSLRCGVWMVFLMALLGNGAVVFVLIFARSKMDVPRFLVCNLGMADFFMGIYLGFLAVVDASTLGQFRMYAIPWQFSASCQVAGFFGVLSSELSVFTLAVITMERNYAITHAMHLNKRLSLRHASYIMALGWFFAFIMAILPLVGVSDYRKFAVCLPFDVASSFSKGYVIFLMFINGVAFLILMGCYLKMYCAIRGSQAWNSNDSRIAKRMALLVFTDFLCWAPIAFFSLTAAFGLQFVSLEEAKVFTVFILPLNSCCNPFLYAILTKQFKKDCVMICKAIEESRVTRGIGRCRHSSNFSNRQTPGNTNSVERNSSKDGSSNCQCQTRLLDQPLRRRRRHRPPRWLHSPLRTFMKRIRTVDTVDMESSSSANEYAYQIAEIQQKQHQRRHHRNHRRAESVSSDNYSSSRSDSVKVVGCGLPMRMVGRRRNSWTVTRKPSSDSNLSSSRNDSSTSAMTASTSAGTNWRHSRSSVSSDCGSSSKSSIRDKSGRGKVAVVALPVDSASGTLPRRIGSFRDKTLPPSPLAAGILRHHSLATGKGNLVQRTVIQSAQTALVAAATAAAASVSGVTLPVGAKCKPRLTRQVAIHEEKIESNKVLEDVGSSGDAGSSSGVSKNVSFRVDASGEPTGDAQGNASGASGVVHYCPIHNRPRLQGVWESSVEEDDEVEEELGGDVTDANDAMDARDANQQIYEAVTAIYTNRDHNRLGLAGFIPRKLSTISSRSCSVNPDANDDVVDVDPNQPQQLQHVSVHTVETDPTSQDANVDDMDTITSVSDAIIGNVALGMIDEEDDEEDAANAERRRPVTESKPLLN